jgi:hypothetical protein
MNTYFLKIENETIDEFDSIAEKLLNHYAIQNHESLYRLTEIEFYWNSPTHSDESTYKRKHTDPENGDWFFHYSGVDIALKSEKLNGHGGILIRSVYCEKDQKVYKGPMVCAMKLFSGTSAFAKSIETRIVKHQFETRSIRKTPRVGLGKNAIEGVADLLEYRYKLDL